MTKPNPIERMRKKQAHLANMPRKAPNSPVAASTPEKVQPPIANVPKHPCGHPVPLAHLCTIFCQACRKKAHIAKMGRRAEKIRQRDDSRRLPDMATFDVAYSAPSQTWSGHLVIGETRFYGEASGVITLLEDLDGQYRKYLKENL